MGRIWFHSDKIFHFFFGKEVVTTVYWLISNPNFCNIAYGLGTTFDDNFWCINQVLVYLCYLLLIRAIKNDSWLMPGSIPCKSNNHTMHCRLAFRGVGPFEGAMSKVDLKAAIKQVFPQNTRLFPLDD